MKVFVETERVILRAWNVENDLDGMSAINSSEAVMRYFPRTYSRQETKKLLEYANSMIEERGFGLFAAQRKQDGALMGFIGLNTPSFSAPFCPCVEIGWRMSDEFWGSGYASEAARACLGFAHSELGLEEVVSFTSTLNTPSIKVMKRIGMRADPSRDFNHPNLDNDSPLLRHVFYFSRRGD